MNSINDYGKAFEDILITSLGRPTDNSVTFANYYNNDFKAKALLFAVCVKERYINSGLYSEEEINQIQSFMDDLPKDKEYTAICKTIGFLLNKMKEQDRIII